MTKQNAQHSGTPAASHTPGPYQVEGTHHVYGIASPNDSGYICTAATDKDAQWIARTLDSHAELLAALRVLVGWLDNDAETLEAMHDDLVSREIAPSNDAAVRLLVETARAAIAKAEGKT